MVAPDVPGRRNQVRHLYRREIADALGLAGHLDRQGVVAVRRDCEQVNAVQRLPVAVQSRCLRLEIQDRLSRAGRHELDRHRVNW